MWRCTRGSPWPPCVNHVARFAVMRWEGASTPSGRQHVCSNRSINPSSSSPARPAQGSARPLPAGRAGRGRPGGARRRMAPTGQCLSPDQPGLGPARSGPADRPRPGQPLGAGGRPCDADVGGRQRHRQGHHLSRLRQRQPHPEGPAGGERARRRPDRAGVQRHPRVRPRRRSALVRVTPSTRAWPSPPPRPGPSCTPPTSTTRASTSSTPASTGSTCRAASGTASCHTAMRPSTSRSWVGGCMSPTPSRTPTGRTRSPVPAAASWTSTAPAGTCCAA
jgi:hypothetical protein